MTTGSFYGLRLNGHARANYSKIGNFVKKMTSFALFIQNRFLKTSLYRALISQDFARAALSGNLDP